MKRTLIIILILALVIAAAYFGITTARERRQSASLSDLQTTVASNGSLTATVGATGMVHSNQTAILVWQTAGNIADIPVAVGETVTAGQVLAALDQSSLSQSIILAQADLINAEIVS